MNGISVADHGTRRFTTSLLLRTADAELDWVNRCFAVVEGVLREDDAAGAAYEIRNDFSP
jgi:hypothetical protein